MSVLSVMALYGTHRLVLICRYYLTRHDPLMPIGSFAELPVVTVQLPLYNEHNVASRLIKAVSAIEYPSDKLEIQVLDDSQDGTSEAITPLIAELKEQGFLIEHIRRTERVGYKAGALANGLKTAKGDFVAVFDADFLPNPDFLYSAINFFTDSKVGMVQMRWGHLNGKHSLMTRAQMMLLDGHFQIEHTARFRSNVFFNFNGTAGIWRKSTIADAGGWEGDTLTEDLDLSYRAQLNGWQFVYLVDYRVPAELPVEVDAFKSQQHRWTAGAVQVFKKLGFRILKAPIPFKVKAEALCHLSANLCYPLLLLIGLLLAPAIEERKTVYLKVNEFPVFDGVIFLFGFISTVAFYTVANKESRSISWIKAFFQAPIALVMGIGLAFSNTLAVIEGLFKRGGVFTRTPKTGDSKSVVLSNKRKVWRSWLVYIEVALAVYFCFSFMKALEIGCYVSIPFITLFLVAYVYQSFLSLQQQMQFSVIKSLPLISYIIFCLFLGQQSIVLAAEASKTQKKTVEANKGRPTAGIFYGKVAYIDTEKRFIFVKPLDSQLSRKTFYIDPNTGIIKDGYTVTFDELPIDQKIALRYFGRELLWVADEIFVVNGEFEPSRYGKMKRRRKKKK